MATIGGEEIRAELFGSTFVIAAHLTRRADAELAAMGITTRQWLLLAILTTAFAGYEPSLSEAADTYGSSRQNIKQICLGLQDRGFVRLVADPADARTTRIALTERVKEFETPGMTERTNVMLDDVFAGLTAEQTHALHELLGTWLAALTAPRSGDASST